MRLQNIQIKHIGDERAGVSQTTGKPWASRNILLGWTEEDGREGYLNASVSGEVWHAAAGLQVGDNVTADLSFRTSLFKSGYVSNDVRILQIGKA